MSKDNRLVVGDVISGKFLGMKTRGLDVWIHTNVGCCPLDKKLLVKEIRRSGVGFYFEVTHTHFRDTDILKSKSIHVKSITQFVYRGKLNH